MYSGSEDRMKFEALFDTEGKMRIVDGTQTNNIIASAQRTKKFNETLEE